MIIDEAGCDRRARPQGEILLIVVHATNSASHEVQKSPFVALAGEPRDSVKAVTMPNAVQQRHANENINGRLDTFLQVRIPEAKG
ncbi:hypothetical protein T07_14976 [Trichinella nelsoni]|uniref:Uncharacterized protein n=1 Tax=Trichinella nelsoni TaxID=6336 RepID=A0A0V0RQV8_9BILA|nr:hypothetical protein T07_14976 [Trichinella nelsoni]